MIVKRRRTRNRNSVLTFNADESEIRPIETDHATILRRPLDCSNARSQKIVLHFPCRGRVLQAAFSPTCAELAFFLQFDRSSQLLRKLQHWIPFLKVEPAPVLGLWCCQLDGRRMRLIGTLDGKFDRHDDLRPHQLAWTPGGKRRSFVYDDVLYDVPAE